MTDARLGVLGRESLVASTGQVKLAGLVREALIVGIGLAGQIQARTFAQGNLTTIFTGVVFAGRIAAQAKAKISGQFHLNVAGRITAKSSAASYFLTRITVAGQIKTMARASLLRVGQTAVAGHMTAQSKARGLVNLQLAIGPRDYDVPINTG
jgi:hypothetical protein